MKILFATMKPNVCFAHAEGIIKEETKNLFIINSLGIGQIQTIHKRDIKKYHIEIPTTGFAQLILK